MKYKQGKKINKKAEVLNIKKPEMLIIFERINDFSTNIVDKKIK